MDESALARLVPPPTYDCGIQEIPVLRTPERIIVRPRVKLTGIGDHMATLSRLGVLSKSGGLPALYGAHETNCNASKRHDAPCLKNVQMPVSNSRLFVCDSQEEPVVENAAHRGDTVALTSDAFTAHIGLQLLFDGGECFNCWSTSAWVRCSRESETHSPAG